MNICKRLKNRTWKQYALYGKQLKIHVKKGLCFSHQSKENLIKSGTYFSALSFDENFIAAATCDPANVNRLADDQGGTEKIFLYNLKENNVSKIIEVPMMVSVVKLIYPKWIICGHFDGNLTAWNFTNEEIVPFKGHHADILAVDINQVRHSFFYTLS